MSRNDLFPFPTFDGKRDAHKNLKTGENEKKKGKTKSRRHFVNRDAWIKNRKRNKRKKKSVYSVHME